MDSGILEEFSVEALELLSEAEDALLILESDSSDENAYNCVFRSFHSLKGAAGMMDLSEIQKHMHLTEDLFESYKSNRDELNKNIDFFLQAIDHTKNLLSGNKNEFDYTKHNTGNSIPTVIDDSLIEMKEVLFIDVVGIEFLQSILFKKLPATIRFNHIKNPIEYFKSKKYIISDAVIIDQSILPLAEEYVKKEISLFCYQSNKPSEFNSREFIPLYDSQSPDQFNILMLQSKTNMNQYRIIEKSYRLLLYQYSDLDRYLKEKGREMVRQTLKSEIKSITNSRKKILND